MCMCTCACVFMKKRKNAAEFFYSNGARRDCVRRDSISESGGEGREMEGGSD